MDDRIVFDILIPTFPVEDVVASAKYYTEKLGFTVTFEEADCYAHVKRGKAVIALYKITSLQERAGCDGFKPPSKARATIFIEGIENLYEDYKDKGVTIIDSPTEVPYGWDMQIEDCDGHVIEFVQFKSN